MNRIIFVMVLLIMSLTAFNFTQASEMSEEDIKYYCSVNSEVAGVINQGRYNGVSYAEADSFTDDNLLQGIIEVIYSMDYMRSESMREEQTIRIKNAVYAACMQNS